MDIIRLRSYVLGVTKLVALVSKGICMVSDVSALISAAVSLYAKHSPKVVRFCTLMRRSV